MLDGNIDLSFVDYRMRLNNLLQATLGAQALRWDTKQAGPEHTTPWTAVALSKSLPQHTTQIANGYQFKALNGDVASTRASQLLKKLLLGRHIAPCIERHTA